jgi:hypothetical protein
MKCKICKNEIEQYQTKKSMKSISKIHEPKSMTDLATKKGDVRHTHHGVPTYKYGICKYNHCTQLEQIKIDWTPCQICLKNKTDLEKRRKHLAIKARKSKKEIPSFLRKELEKFEEKMTKKIDKAISEKVSEKIQHEMNRVLEVISREDGAED